MAIILNLTQHKATPEQVSAGVVEPTSKKSVQELLTFTDIPTKTEIASRAKILAGVADAFFLFADRPDSDTERNVMVGGAPFFMGPLEAALKARGIQPLYAFSMRESKDVPQEDGSVKKVVKFKHLGFVEV